MGNFSEKLWSLLLKKKMKTRLYHMCLSIDKYVSLCEWIPFRVRDNRMKCNSKPTKRVWFPCFFVHGKKFHGNSKNFVILYSIPNSNEINVHVEAFNFERKPQSRKWEWSRRGDHIFWKMSCNLDHIAAHINGWKIPDWDRTLDLWNKIYRCFELRWVLCVMVLAVNLSIMNL